WGVKNTKYRSAIDELPFLTTCSIPVPQSFENIESISADFVHFGDSKCRGWVSTTLSNKTLVFMIDVWAYRGGDQRAIMDINLIYDAVVEQLQFFMKER
ncbi:MAG: hypothetical protein R3183_08790, partial [Oleiphilaceae bacterium]|nr:hypothetical protein [Oleiphilaceae bacterium]